MAKKRSRTENVAFNLASGLAGQVLQILIRFVTRTYFIYILGTMYLGINGLFTSVLSMLSLTELGFSSAIVYRMYQPLIVNDNKHIRILLKIYKKAYLFFGTLIILLGLCMIPLLPRLIHDYDSLAELKINATLLYLIYLGQSAASYFFFAYRRSVMEASQKKYILDMAEYCVDIIRSVAQVLVLIHTKNFIIYSAVSAAFTIVVNCVNAVIAGKYYPEFFIREDASLDKDEIWDIFKDCMALFVYKVNDVVLKATDNILLSSIIGLGIVGIYDNYLLIVSIIRSVLRQLQTAIRHSMGDLFNSERLEKRYIFFKSMGLLNFALYGTAAVGVALCANEFLAVWLGHDYTLSQPIPILCGLEILSQGIIYNLALIRTTTGIFQQMWYRPLMSAGLNVAVSYCLIWRLGISGVIIGTIAAYLLVYLPLEPVLIYKYSFQNFFRISEYYSGIGKSFLLLVGVYLFDFWLCSWLFQGMGWFSVIAHVIVIGCTVPTSFVVVYRKTEEFVYLVRHLKMLVCKFFPKGENG